MGEVYHFNECRVVSMTGTVETRLDAFAEDVSVDVTHNLYTVKNESGNIVKRFPSGTEVGITIGRLYSGTFSHPDGNNIKFFYENVSGTVTYQAGSVYLANEGQGQGEDANVTHDLKFVGGAFGTV